MKNISTETVDLFSHVISILTSCCADSNFTMECADHIKSQVISSGIKKIEGNSADIALIIWEQLLYLLSERKKTQWCSEIAKKYIKSLSKNTKNKILEEEQLNICLKEASEEVRTYYILKYVYLLRKRDIIVYMKKHYFQIIYYNCTLKKILKCKDIDLLLASEYINKDFIEEYNMKINYCLKSQYSGKWDRIASCEAQSEQLDIYIIIIALLWLIHIIFDWLFYIDLIWKFSCEKMICNLFE